MRLDRLAVHSHPQVEGVGSGSSLFGVRLRELRIAAGLSQPALGRLVNYHPSLISKVETGVEAPSRVFAARVDEVLGAGGSLLALAGPVRLTPDEDERLVRAARVPSRVDGVVVDALAAVLAGQRRVDDVMGSAALVRPVGAQLVVVERLVVQARGRVRPRVLDVAHQWAQFAGWLYTNVGRPDQARRWFATALEWATEAGNRDMIATVLSFQGHVAWSAGEIGRMISLSQAAQRDVHVFPGQRAFAALQEARGHAIVGDAMQTERAIDAAASLCVRASECRDVPSWMYFQQPAFFTLARGLVYRYLGRESARHNRRAIDLLRSGLAGLPGDMRRSDWAGEFLYQLAVAHLQDGDRAEAEHVIAEVEEVATATRSAPLAAKVRGLRRHLRNV